MQAGADVEGGPAEQGSFVTAPRADEGAPVTFTATDSCGNTGAAAANVIIMVADNNIPIVTAPAPLAMVLLLLMKMIMIQHKLM